MLDAAGNVLRAELISLFQQPVDSTFDDAVFDAHARAVHVYQYERNAPYAAYCDRRRAAPAHVDHWTRIPAVPAGAFKVADLVVLGTHAAEAVFRTSGTTHGGERRGAHYVPDIGLYHASLLPNFRARLLPDDASMPILSLMPHARELPDSSLAHMITHVIEQLGGDGSGYHATVRDGIDTNTLERALAAHIERRTPVCLLGTSFSYVHWLDDLRERSQSFLLPEGSRLMDTGGYKGRSREVPPPQMLASYGALLGLPTHACINEYGMTELCSQMYDAVLTDVVRGRAAHSHIKRPPPWLRARIVDPVSLEPMPAGRPGLVQLFDLANLGSVVAIQTEDMGLEVNGGYLVTGRAPGATPRGCSIAMDDMLHAVRAARPNGAT